MQTEFQTIWTYVYRDINILVFGLFYGLSDNEFEFWHISIEIQGFDLLPRNEEYCGHLQSKFAVQIGNLGWPILQ